MRKEKTQKVTFCCVNRIPPAHSDNKNCESCDEQDCWQDHSLFKKYERNPRQEKTLDMVTDDRTVCHTKCISKFASEKIVSEKVNYNLSLITSSHNNAHYLYHKKRQHVHLERSPTGNTVIATAHSMSWLASLQQPKIAFTLLCPVSTKKLLFDGKRENLELFRGIFSTRLPIMPPLTESAERNHLHNSWKKWTLNFSKTLTLSIYRH